MVKLTVVDYKYEDAGYRCYRHCIQDFRMLLCKEISGPKTEEN
jgi:hypothetical protein